MKFIKTFLLQNNKNNNNNNKLRSKWYLGCERLWAMVFFSVHLGYHKPFVQVTRLSIFFYIGEFNRNKLDGTETPIRVKRIVIHPGYDRYSMAHNIALLELENPVKLNDHIRMVSWRVVAIISRLFLLVVAFGINEDSWDGKSIELRCDRTFSAEKYKFAVSRMFMAHVYLLNKWLAG